MGRARGPLDRERRRAVVNSWVIVAGVVCVLLAMLQLVVVWVWPDHVMTRFFVTAGLGAALIVGAVVHGLVRRDGE